MIIKKVLLLTLLLVSGTICCCQPCEIQLKYKICHTEFERFYFPVQPGDDLTKYVEKEELDSDTLLIFINTKISERVNTLKNGTVTVSGVRYKRYYYNKRRFFHRYTPARNLGSFDFIKMIVDDQIYIFKKGKGKKYELIAYFLDERGI